MPRSETAKAVNKRSIISRAESLLVATWPEIAFHTGHCLYSSVCIVKVLAEQGIEAIIQTGTCYWPRLTREMADENKNSEEVVVFGYEWEPKSQATIQAIKSDLLPELHVWVAIPDTSEIIDMASGLFPAQCQWLAGLDWPGLQPPNCFWCQAGSDQWPWGVQYLPCRDAIDVAWSFIRKLFVRKLF